MVAINVFRNFIHREPNGELNVSRILSKECFNQWQASNKSSQSNNTIEKTEKRFRRALTNHVTGVDGRIPFEEEEEAALLCLLRKTKPWPCLTHSGRLGFRGKGYHERKQSTGGSSSTSRGRWLQC
jgi:hypothetical protein